MSLTRTFAYNPEHVYFAAAASCLLLLLGAYMYLVSLSVVHVVMQKELKRDFTMLHSEIAALETEYIQAQHAVSADIATLQGFVPTTEKIFLDRSEDSVVVLRTQ